jgi:hypothetical protein
VTEQEWLSCDDVWPMLEWLADQPKRRLAIWLGRSCGPDRLRVFYLFAAACYARIDANSFRPGSRAVVASELWSRRGTEQPRGAAPWFRGASSPGAVAVEEWARRWADAASRSIAWRQAYSTGGQFDRAVFSRVRGVERGIQADLLRCIHGSPFREQAVDLDWLETAGQKAEKLARRIAATGAFERIPELVDVLEDAGCPDDDLVNHCRQPGAHARGCWAIELLAGKDVRHRLWPVAQSSDAIFRPFASAPPELQRTAREIAALIRPAPGAFTSTRRPSSSR